MNTTTLDLLHSVPGLEIRPDGQTVLSGPALAALEAVDAMVLSWADQLGAERYSYSPLLSARQLHKVEHFSSFPHQVVFPASVNQDRLEGFASLHGPEFYGLEPTDAQITLQRHPWTVPESYRFAGEELVPFRAGNEIGWQLIDG